MAPATFFELWDGTLALLTKIACGVALPHKAANLSRRQADANTSESRPGRGSPKAFRSGIRASGRPGTERTPGSRPPRRRHMRELPRDAPLVRAQDLVRPLVVLACVDDVTSDGVRARPPAVFACARACPKHCGALVNGRY